MNNDLVLAKLPNPFVLPGGMRADTPGMWRALRLERLNEMVGLLYGGMPPEPEIFGVEPLHIPGCGRLNSYRIHAGTCDKQVAFVLQLFVPGEGSGPYPVVLTGDGCYENMDREVATEINRRGMIAARFNRTEIVSDIAGIGRAHGLYQVYPEHSFGALSAWAWGYQRCMDALQTMDFADTSCVAITGHSRGGKTVLLAGATDERFAWVNPNNSGAGGTASWRYQMRLNDAPTRAQRSETLQDLIERLSFWFGPGLAAFAGHEETLPFDQFMLMAMVAPRSLLDTQGLADYWCNPPGTMQSYLAAREVYRMLGAEDAIALRYRPGGHGHGLDDYRMLLNFMQGLPPEPLYAENPYENMRPCFDWNG